MSIEKFKELLNKELLELREVSVRDGIVFGLKSAIEILEKYPGKTAGEYKIILEEMVLASRRKT